VSSTLAQSVPVSTRLHSKDAAPVIAVSATADTRLGGAHRVRLNSTYITALESAGLIPIVIPPLSSPDQARAILERVDGLLVADVGAQRVGDAAAGADAGGHRLDLGRGARRQDDAGAAVGQRAGEGGAEAAAAAGEEDGRIVEVHGAGVRRQFHPVDRFANQLE